VGSGVSDDGSVLRSYLRTHRLSAGMSQQQLAEASGLSVRAIGDLERGRARRPHPDSLRRLADALCLRDQARAEFFAAGQRRDTAVAAALADFSGLETRSQRPGALVPRQLPAPARHFAGRSRELAVLTGLLERAGQDARPTVVISAISGMAGVGKTALAVQFARQIAGAFPDGQLYVNLRGYDAALPPMPVTEAVRLVLDAFQVPAEEIPASSESQAGLYRTVLYGKKVLIVADNAADAAQVRPLLPGSPGCLVIATSRSTLAGLVATDGAIPMSLDVLTEAEARDLLARILGDARVAGEPGAAGQLIDACGRLPLALAITAARAATRPELPLAAVAAELAAAVRLDALDAGDPLANVRAALACSYQHLTGDAARMFRLLGVHPGPDISVPAAASLAGLPCPPAARHLAELADASLIAQDSAGRYAVHDLVRLYAAELAERAGAEREAATIRLLDHYVLTGHAAAMLICPTREPLTLTAASRGTSPEDLASYDEAASWLDAERRALMAAIEHAVAARQDRHAWNLAWALHDHLQNRGLWHDQLRMWTIGLAAAKRLNDLSLEAKSLNYLAWNTAKAGRPGDALQHFEQALGAFGGLDQPVWQANVHIGQAMTLAELGQFAPALEQCRDALELYTAAGHLVGQANALNGIGWFLSQLGDFAQALTACEGALALCREAGARDIEAETIDSLGLAHHQLGHHAEAISCYQEALVIYRQLDSSHPLAKTLARLGDLHNTCGDLDEASTAWREALAILEDLQHPDAEQLRAKLHAADAGHTAAAKDTDPRG
jgi:tetratricopeptide (TPR) repeat protein/transcriptional regulator with XRE-family HTH domain